MRKINIITPSGEWSEQMEVPRIGDIIILPNERVVRVKQVYHFINLGTITAVCSNILDVAELYRAFKDELESDGWNGNSILKLFNAAVKKIGF